jgi:hypothetical protein
VGARNWRNAAVKPLKMSGSTQECRAGDDECPQESFLQRELDYVYSYFPNMESSVISGLPNSL